MITAVARLRVNTLVLSPPAPLPPSCFAGWSPFPAVAGQDEEAHREHEAALAAPLLRGARGPDAKPESAFKEETMDIRFG